MPMTHEASRSMSFHWAPGRDEVVEEEGGREWKLRDGRGGGGGGDRQGVVGIGDEKS